MVFEDDKYMENQMVYFGLDSDICREGICNDIGQILQAIARFRHPKLRMEACEDFVH